jgi:hypothetical protein
VRLFPGSSQRLEFIERAGVSPEGVYSSTGGYPEGFPSFL